MKKLFKYIAMAMLVLGVVAGCRPNATPSLKVVPSMGRTAQKSQGLGPATAVTGAPRLSSTRVLTLGTTLPQMRGVNLPGGEMWYGHNTTDNPVSGQDYLFVSHQDIDYLISRGVNFGRLLFSWEGIQPTPYASFPTTGNNGTYANTFIERVNYATSKGMIVMIEPHGADTTAFAKYKGNFVGTAAVPNSQFADLWTRLATQFKGNSNVVLGLTNEPNGMSTVQWFNAAQAAVVGIRSTGAVNLIMVEGNGWSGAESWTSSWYDTATPQVSNATAWKIIQDPLNNTVAEVHSYFDANAGGGANDIVSPTIGVDRLKVTVDWAKANGVKIHLGEFGTTNTSAAQTAVTNMLAYLDQNKSVVTGWAWWAYGPPAWWGGYQFTLDPTSNYTVDAPQMAWMKPYFVGANPPIADAGVVDAGPGPSPSPTTPTNPIAFTKGVVFTTNSGTTNWVYVPTTYDVSHATPTSVLVWLHGCGGQNQYDVSMVSPGGSQNWISLAPGGAEGACWNVGADSAKVLAALADLKTHFNVDPRRVVLGGYSSGGDLTYRTAFYNAKLFSGVIVENSSPFRDTGSTQAQSLAAAAWKFNVAHLLHTGDTTYAPTGVRTELAALTTAGFPVTKIEKPGTHYDSGASYDTPGSTPGDLRAFLLPFMNAGWLTPNVTPPPPVDAGTDSGVDAGPPPPAPCVYTYSVWGACQSTGVQTRTATSTPVGCVGTPILSQTCTFTPPTTDTDGDGIVDALDKCPTVKGIVTTATSTNGCPALVVTAVKTYDWGTGYCKQYYFKNVNPMPMPWKSMIIYLNDGKLRGTTAVWGGSFPNPTATGKVVVTPAGNSPVPAGTNMQAVGFCADYGPTKYVGTNGGISY